MIVQSISRPVLEWADHFPQSAHLLAVFNRALDFVIDDAVIALVESELMNGPFQVVVSNIPVWNQPHDIQISIHDAGWSFGSWILDMTHAPLIWDPYIVWDKMTWSQTSLSHLRAIFSESSPRRRGDTPFAQTLGSNPPKVLDELRTALQAGSTQSIQSAVAKIAGLGPGLTPSGDDFLAGVMLSAHAFSYPCRDLVHRLCTIIYESAAPRTTILSRAFLKAACEGMAYESWHILLSALTEEGYQDIQSAAEDVLAFGETSGLDMLAGFLWMSEITLPGYLRSVEPIRLTNG